jgi:hypothetical protein
VGSMCVVTPSTNATSCVPLGSRQEGQSCSLEGDASAGDAATANECAAGLYCLSGTCARYCCTDHDCDVDGSLGFCSQQQVQGSGEFGVCTQ